MTAANGHLCITWLWWPVGLTLLRPTGLQKIRKSSKASITHNAQPGATGLGTVCLWRRLISWSSWLQSEGRLLFLLGMYLGANSNPFQRPQRAGTISALTPYQVPVCRYPLESCTCLPILLKLLQKNKTKQNKTEGNSSKLILQDQTILISKPKITEKKELQANILFFFF